MKKKILPLDVYFRYINNHPLNDLKILDYGYENCRPDKPQIGPSQKPRYSFHFVVSGKGYFYLNEKKYEVRANQIFVVPMHAVTNYYPDPANPWSYFWLEIHGAKAEHLMLEVGLTKNSPIYAPKNHLKIRNDFIKLITLPGNVNADYYSLSTFFDIMDILYKEYKSSTPDNKRSNTDSYVQYVLTYMENNYANNELMNLKIIGDQIFLNPIYLNRIFTEKVGTPIYSYLTQFRLQKACELLEKTEDSVSSIAKKIGYENPLHFSRMFKKYKNISPQKYREIIATTVRKEDAQTGLAEDHTSDLK